MIMALGASASDTENPPLPTPMTDAPRLVASDIDGTLLVTGQLPAVSVIEAIAAVRDAGHHLVLATGRSLAGALAAAREMGVAEGWIVTSNGAVTARLIGGSCSVTDVHEVNAEAVVRLVTSTRPDLQIAAEIIGIGYHVTSPFLSQDLNGDQVKIARLSDLWAEPTPRLALHGPHAHLLVPELRAVGVTAIAIRPDWIDVTPGGITKASAVERVRRELAIAVEHTVAIGDGENDVELLQWAWRGVAMGHASEAVREAADEVTGGVAEGGVVPVLWSLLAPAARD